jgi:pyruvate/2-oxoglutarate dehydrogenase complex dihydrolipoamide acyltransferase (E2) component
MAYITMAPMYPTMTSGKVDEFLVSIGDTVKVGMPSEYEGVVKEIYANEGEYIETDTPIIEIEEEKGE